MYAYAVGAMTSLNPHECVVCVNGQEIVVLLGQSALIGQVAGKGNTSGTGQGYPVRRSHP